ncbi:hypothetical protein FHS39_002627 [Streptomyces olivoverticillatus]|uniref:Iminophenyl-pyruvate dimer synthase domain-containing protein n=1 Tax=Streptomyces olivoverticillatus TaxID=66427 RepID=A0A7W7LPV9_9ACTN|nr:hypothetical protein [Streptomyces olivoverticillatus]
MTGTPGITGGLHRVAEPPFHVPRDRTELHVFLQAALTLEHLTIPPYLTGMYSLRPGANRPAFYAIRAVVLEEMLHMTLVANLLNAVDGTPLVAHSSFVTGYPARLPYSRDEVPVALRHFGTEALDTFLTIERPEYVAEPPGHPATPADEGWTSIGQFYNTIREGVLRLLAAGGGRAGRQGVDHVPGGRGREVGVARRGRPDGTDELRRRRVLEQEARAALAQRPQDVVALAEGGQDQGADAGCGAAQFGEGGQPVHHGHLDVEQGDVRPVPPRQLHGLASVRRLGDDLDILGRGEDHPDARPDEGLVVGDDDADHLVSCSLLLGIG